MGSYAEEMNMQVQVPGVNGKLTIVEKAVPAPPADGFILKTHFAGICHTDLHVWKNQIKISDQVILGMADLVPDFSYPFVMGHEFSGEIHSIGENYTGDRQVGDRIAVYPWLGCSDCDTCKAGDTNMCQQTLGRSPGIGREGGYQAYVPVPDVKNALPVPEGVGMDVAALFGCSALTAFNAVNRVKDSIVKAHDKSGSSNLLVIGAGGLGLWVIQWAKALLPANTKVFVADIADDKLTLAKEYGAYETILWARGVAEEELIAKTKEVTRGGIDGCVDLVGIPATVNKAFTCANKCATLVLVGIAGGVASLPIVGMALNAVTVTGVYTGTQDQMKDMMDAFAKHHVEAPPISVVKPAETEEALRNLMEGKVTGRSVIQFAGTKSDL